MSSARNPDDHAMVAAGQRAASAHVRMNDAVRRYVARDSQRAAPAALLLGVKHAAVEHSALLEILLSKGFLSHEEYFEALARWTDVVTRTLEAEMESPL